MQITFDAGVFEYPLPELPTDAAERVEGKERRALAKLKRALRKFVRDKPPESVRGQQLVPLFEEYCRRVLDAKAEEHLKASSDLAAFRELVRKPLPTEAVMALKPDKLCLSSGVEPDESCFLEHSFDEMLEGWPETRLRFDDQGNDYEEKVEVEPWSEIDYSGVWEEALGWLRSLGYHLPDEVVRALRDPGTWCPLSWKLVSALEPDADRWEAKALEHPNQEPSVNETADAATHAEDGPTSVGPSLRPLEAFAELEVRIISDDRAMLYWGGQKTSMNFIEMGFEDGRSKNRSVKSWGLLRLFAEKSGCIERDIKVAKTLEKRIEELRKRLRKLFRCKGDPIEWTKADGTYRTRFKISAADPDRF